MISDFFSFRQMLAPRLITGIFWLAVFFSIICGIVEIFSGAFWQGLGALLFGPFVVRLICEGLIVFFRINETLTEIKNILKEK